jgi:hypothetical protein
MNRKPPADAVAAVDLAVAAYCEAINVPDIDEAAVAARLRNLSDGGRRVRFRMRAGSVVAYVAVALTLAVALSTIPAVIAGAERVLRAFTLIGGRTTPLTTRTVDLERARADMPFVVVAPPAIAGLPSVSIDEVAGGDAGSSAELVFQIRGAASGREVTFVESKFEKNARRTLISIGPSIDSGTPQFAPPPGADGGGSALVLHGYAEGRTFVPSTWVDRGTRIVLLAPPGALTAGEMRDIRAAMSH